MAPATGELIGGTSRADPDECMEEEVSPLDEDEEDALEALGAPAKNDCGGHGALGDDNAVPVVRRPPATGVIPTAALAAAMMDDNALADAAEAAALRFVALASPGTSFDIRFTRDKWHESRPKRGEQLLNQHNRIARPSQFPWTRGSASQRILLTLERWQKHQKLPAIGLPFHQSQNGSQ
eukprot:g10024.t1